MAAAAKFEAIEEWNLWKSEHGRQYSSINVSCSVKKMLWIIICFLILLLQEELERHIIWLSNKKYIEEHNANTDLFGYTLSLNRFGDLVS